MNIKKFLVFGLFAAVIGTAFANTETDQASATTKKYVMDELSELQTTIPAQSGARAVTYTTTPGGIAPREVKTNLGSSTGDNAMPTVGAVNTGLATKQNTISAVDTNTVLTYTDTAGTVGQKGIYQDNGTYAEQQSNLIDAGTFNAALQNALNMEFVCAGYVDDDPTKPCWLWQINNTYNPVAEPYVSATGTVEQNGTPSPTNPIYPTFYQQGDMVLRRVGEYADSYDATTGKITRRIGVKVLDGTETWSTYGGYDSADYVYVLQDINNKRLGHKISLCSHFRNRNASWATCCGVNGDYSDHSTFVGLAYFNTSQHSTLNEFKQWIREQYATGTPVTLYYQLETPTEEDWSQSTYNKNVYIPQNQ